MKLASSIRYGGLLIDPIDADSNSYKHLGLVCPICSRGVYLVAEASRKTHVRKTKLGTVPIKSSQVQSHFAHFPDVSHSIVADCELRSSQISRLQVIASQAKSKGQRLKIFQSHFWRICTTSIFLTDIDAEIEILPVLWQESDSARSEIGNRALLESLVDFTLEYFTQSVNMELSKRMLFDDLPELIENLRSQETIPGFQLKSIVAIEYTPLELRMQTAICHEALSFLSQKRQRPILDKLARHALFDFFVYCAILKPSDTQNQIADKLRISTHRLDAAVILADPLLRSRGCQGIKILHKIRSRSEFGTFFWFIRDRILEALVFVDWAEEFTRLENKHLARSVG